LRLSKRSRKSIVPTGEMMGNRGYINHEEYSLEQIFGIDVDDEPTDEETRDFFD
jgi:hypothetical protein